MFFIVLFEPTHGREQLDKVLKKSFVKFYFWGITLKAKFKETYEAKLKLLGGGGGAEPKNPPWRVKYGYFPEVQI